MEIEEYIKRAMTCCCCCDV